MKRALVTNLLLEELIMGRGATRFVELREKDRALLEQQLKHDPSHAIRSRTHSIPLNSQQYCMVQIRRIPNVSFNAVENWLRRGNNHGHAGLADGLRTGLPPKFDIQYRNVLKEIV
jgi:hypothetical protein